MMISFVNLIVVSLCKNKNTYNWTDPSKKKNAFCPTNITFTD